MIYQVNLILIELQIRLNHFKHLKKNGPPNRQTASSGLKMLLMAWKIHWETYIAPTLKESAEASTLTKLQWLNFRSTGIPTPRGPRMIEGLNSRSCRSSSWWQPHPEWGGRSPDSPPPPPKKTRVWPPPQSISSKKTAARAAWMVIFNFTKELCACFTGKRKGGWDPGQRPAVKWKSGWGKKIWEWPKNCYS